jgi:hypothetical protein
MKTFVLGDLSKSDSHRYFFELIKTLPREFPDLFQLDERSFDKVFHLTGGRMVLIEDYVYEATSSKILPDGEYSISM